MGRSTTPMHFPARGYPRTPPFEKLQRMRSFNGDINQRQWTASQFKQMPSRLTLSSLRRAEGRIANRLNSAALNSVLPNLGAHNGVLIESIIGIPNPRTMVRELISFTLSHLLAYSGPFEWILYSYVLT